MLNRDIRRTALYIFRNTPVSATIVAGVNTGIVYLLFEVAENLLNSRYILLMLLRAVILTVWSILANYFSMRSWILGKCRFDYLAEPLKNGRLRKRLVPLSIAMTVIYLLLAIPVAMLLVSLVLGSFATIADISFDFDKLFAIAAVYGLLASIVINALSFAAYVFASGAKYSTAGTLKRGFVYLARNWAGWLWFDMTVAFMPWLIRKLLELTFKSNPVITILYLPVKGYIMIARAGYVYENILRMEYANEAAYSYAADSMAKRIR